MRVLILNYEYSPIGGGGAQVSHMGAQQLVIQGHEVDVVTMSYPGLPRYENRDGVSVYRVPCLRGRKEVSNTLEMASYVATALPLALKLVRSNNYDINHTHFIIPTGIISLLVKRLSGLPYLVTAHGSDVPGYNKERFKIGHRLAKPIWDMVVKGAERIVAPSEYLRQLILQTRDVKNLTVIPNGYDHSRLSASKDKEKRILVVSRMVKGKGVQKFLDALRGMELDGYQIDIVGDGPYLPELKQKANGLGLKVKFWGWLKNSSDELTRLYEKSSILAFTSEGKTSPLCYWRQ